MAFEYNGFIHRDLEPQVRYDAEQIQVLKQQKSNATNIENGTGQDSLVQKYSGEVDDTHFASSTTGESDVCLGGANISSGKRNIIGGSLNENAGSNNLIGGLRNNISSNHNVVGGQDNNSSQGHDNLIGGQQNTVKSYDNIVAGHENSVSENGQSNIVAGEQNILGKVTNSIICGDNNSIEIQQLIGGIKAGLDLLNNSDIKGKALLGHYNSPKTNTLLEIGNGEHAGKRSNAFEVLKDGRAKVQTAPVDDDDVVRKIDLTGGGGSGGGKLYKHIITVSGTKTNGAPYDAVWSIVDNHNKTYTFQDIIGKYYPFSGGIPIVVYSDDPATSQFLALLNHQYKIVVGLSVQSDLGTAANFKDTVTEI